MDNKYFDFNNGILNINGISIEDIYKKYGTPIYIMNKNYIDDMCNSYFNALKNYYGKGLISYASKAFSCKEIYRIINSHNMACDVVSGGELFTALSVNFPVENIIFHGNNKSFDELELAISNKIGLIVVDAISELQDINNLSIKYNTVQNILIRVNPGVEAHTHHYIQTSKIDSKFGFSIQNGDAENIIKLCKNYSNIKLKGLHCHIGSQIFEEKSFQIATDKMLKFFKFVKDTLNIEFEILNLGGGFGIYYSNDDKIKSPNEYGDYIKVISETIKEKCNEYGLNKPFLILEPGRSIVGEAGITLYKIGRIKKITNVKDYISIDGGMFENPRYALYSAKYSVIPPTKTDKSKTHKYSIAGKCCESGDLIAEDVLLPEMKEGELLAVLSTGAYNYSMASNYNRNLIPPVVLIENNKTKYIIKPSNYEDLIRNDL